MHRITFLPHGPISRTPDGTTIFDAAAWAGVQIENTCGGHGACGRCKVRIAEGAKAAGAADQRHLSTAEIEKGWRLACRTAVHRDCRVETVGVPGYVKAAPDAAGRPIALCPNLRKVHLRLGPPSEQDRRPDLQRICDALRAAGFEARAIPAVLRQLPQALRTSDFSATAVICGDEWIAVEPGETTARSFGLAIDIGTTTVAGRLLNLNTGAVEAKASLLNRQAAHGADVISRVQYAAGSAEALSELQHLIAETVNQMAGQMLTQCDARREEIYEAVAVGNAIMLHLLLGIDPTAMGVSPFVPTVQSSVTLPAAAVGVQLYPEARLSTLPHVGAYVGADIVSGLLATNLLRQTDGKPRLFLDLGTNSEIVLVKGDRAWCAAAPAGPAFEGAQIRHGMRASEGAIDGVQIGEDIHICVVGDAQRALGICGSGLVDAVAALLQCGLITSSGRLLRRTEAPAATPKAVMERLADSEGEPIFLLSVPEDGISLSQKDVRALQLAKGAVACGTRLLLERAGVDPQELEAVLLAGAFGSDLTAAGARRIGLTPDVPIERIHGVGNTALLGAQIALLCASEGEAARQMPFYLEYLELSECPEFNQIFVESMPFPAKDF
jgi:uncharacterized 2Fe-2S/4Fe-4S cluster protein (DUF4445 family)